MKRLFGAVVVLFFSLMLMPSLIAQVPVEAVVAYGETVGGLFAEETAQEWSFTVQERELFALKVQRVGGTFQPSMAVFAPDGSPLDPTATAGDAYEQSAEFMQGAPQTGTYRVRVTGEKTEFADNPNEYTLSLTHLGRRRANTDEGLPPVPTITPFPELRQGSAQATPQEGSYGLKIQVYGNPSITRPDPNQQANRWVMRQSAFTVMVNNANPIDRSVEAFTFLSNGVGFLTKETKDVTASQFFADQSFTEFSVTQGIFSVVLQDGTTIKTDFYKIASLQAVDGRVVLQMTDGNRLIFEGRTFEFVRRGGVQGEGPNVEPIHIFKFDGFQLTTDLVGWQTLYYDGNGYRILYGADMRLIMTQPLVELHQQGNNSTCDPITGTNPNFTHIFFNGTCTRSDWSIRIDPFGMGDVRVDQNMLSLQPLDGRDIQEPIANVANVWIEDKAFRIARKDGTFRLSLPDFTDIQTPNARPNALTVLPYQVDFRPQYYNNLGTTHFDYFPVVEFVGVTPYNRVNGNFYYPVEDVFVQSHALPLSWTRHYNSLSRKTRTPDYMLQSPMPYLMGQLGAKWRHSYQYELDLTYEPLGDVRLILPDGSEHLFTPSNEPNTYLSSSLLPWRVRRLNGLTGGWEARTVLGMVYTFDRAGRLTRLTDGQGNPLLLSRAPKHAVLEAGLSDGFYVTERYGRRIEALMDSNRRVVLVKQEYETRYHYDEAGALVQVTYPSIAKNALDERGNALINYEYDADFRMVRLLDYNSPYHHEIELIYAPDGKVTQYTVSPSEMPVVTTLSYANLLTTETLALSDSETRTTRWVIDTSNRIIERQRMAETETRTLKIAYDLTTGQLSQYGNENGTFNLLRYDTQGLLLTLKDPNNNEYKLEYVVASDGFTRLVSVITYPSEGNMRRWEQFTYDLNTQQLLSHTRPIDDKRNFLTRFAYDDMGRLSQVFTPDTVDSAGEQVTEYSYDRFGYVNRVAEYPSLRSDVKRTLETQFDIGGRLVELVDWRGNPVSMTWENERQLITSVTYGEPNDPQKNYAVTYTYDAHDRLTEQRTQGLNEAYVYNALYQVTSYTDGAGRITRYRYDKVGNLIEKIDPDPNELLRDTQVYQYRYNAFDELIEEIRPGRRVYRYNYTIASTETLKRVLLPSGETVLYRYNLLGRLTQVLRSDISNTETFHYTMRYSPMGELLEMKEIHDPYARTLWVVYDAMGNPTSVKLNDATTTFSYNHASRLVSVTSPNGKAQTRFEYGDNQIRAFLPDNDTNPNDQPIYVYDYDESGNLVTWTDALGHTTQYTYDLLNRLVAEIDPLGQRTTYGYDPRDNLTRLTDALGTVVQAEYNDANNLVKLINGNNIETRYSYDNVNRIVEISMPGGFPILFTYSVAGELVAERVTETRQTLFSYDVLGRMTNRTNALGHTTTFAYNNYGRLSQVIDSVGNIQRFLWNSSGRLSAYTSARNSNFGYASDKIGRLTQVFPPLGQTVDFTYDSSGYIEDVGRTEDGDRVTYKYTYNPNGTLASITLPKAPRDVKWQFVHDKMGQLVSMTSPLGNATRYTYDALGRITMVTLPNGLSEQYGYDAVGNVIRYVAPNGLESTFEYDQDNRLTRRIDAINGQTRTYLYDYDVKAPQLTVTDPQNNATQYFFDNFGNLVSVGRTLKTEDAETSVRYEYEYDLANNLISVKLPDDLPTAEQPIIRMTYNALNQRVRYVDAERASWAYTYDALGNLLQLSDPLGGFVRYAYDEGNRITTVTYSNGATAELRYNTGVRKTSVPENRPLDPGNRSPIIYEFDANGYLISIDHSGSRVNMIEFVRDVEGNVQTLKLANGKSVSMTYDSMGNLTEVNGENYASKRTYTPSGQLETLTLNNQKTTFTYDAFGDLTRYQGQVTATYGYDGLSHLINRSVPEWGDATYTYDSLYRMTEFIKGEEQVTYTYNQLGWVVGVLYPNGMEITYDYYANGRVKEVFALFDSGFRRFFYEYDDAGNVLRAQRDADKEEQLTRRTLFSYDTLNQLLSERWLNKNDEVVYAVSYTYDLEGNRTESSVIIDGQLPFRTVFSYGEPNRKNQLEVEYRDVPPDIIDRYSKTVVPKDKATTVNYAYDNAGNLITKRHPQGELTYRYDVFNRLVSVSGINEKSERVDTTFSYDGFGRVASVGVQDVLYRLIYDVDQLLFIERQAPNQPVERETFTYDLGGRLLWSERDGVRRYPIYDGLGSIRQWIDETGQVVGSDSGLNYNAFGQFIAPYGGDSDPIDLSPQILFAGHLYEPSTGLYLMGMRAYSPELGRFIQRDPIRHDPQSSLYTYVNNRPTVLTDPTGAFAEAIFNPLDSVLLPQVDMNKWMPSPLLPNVETLNSVAQAQMNETFRVLNVANQLRYAVNEWVFLAESDLCGVYVSNANHFPTVAIQQAQAPFDAFLTLFQSQSGWHPTTHPDPRMPIDRTVFLSQTRELLQRALNNGRGVGGNCATAFSMPTAPTVQASAWSAQTADIWDSLQEVSLFLPLQAQSDFLFGVPNSFLAIQAPQADNSVIDPQIAIPKFGVFGAVFEQTRQTFFEILSPLTLTPAVQAWSATLAIDTAPPVFNNPQPINEGVSP